MRSSILMAIANLRKKKLQSILIGLTIMLSALVFSTAIGILESLQSPVEAMFNKLNASHDVLFISKEINKVEDIEKWLRSQEEVEGVQTFYCYNLSEKISFNGKTSEKEIRLTERPFEEVVQDKIQIVEGENNKNPGKNEVWIPTGFAYSNNIKIGDILNVPIGEKTQKLKVSAIVVDTLGSSTFFGTIRFWVGPGEFKNLTTNGTYNSVTVGIRYKDYSESGKLWNKFEQHLNSPFSEYKFKYKDMMFSYTVLNTLIGSVLLAFSGIILMVTIFIIFFTISNSVLSDYTTIGILKAQGFSSKGIRAIYSLQFVVIAIVTIPLGILFSYIAREKVMYSLLKAIGMLDTKFSMINPAVLTFIILIFIIVLSSYTSSLRTERVKPVEAIRYGAPAKKYSKPSKFSLIGLKNLPMAATLGLKQLAAYKMQTIFLIVIISITAFILAAAFNSYNSLIHLGSNLPYWGFDASPVSIQIMGEGKGLSKDELIEKLNSDNRVKTVVPWRWSAVAWKSENEAEGSQIFEVHAFEGDMNKIGLINMEGRNPITDNEVSLAINTSKETKKNVGDYIDLYVRGKKKSFLVTGIYQTMVNGGTGARFQKEAIKEAIDSDEGQLYSVNLEEDTNIKLFIEDMKEKFGDKIDIKETYDVYKGFFVSITENMALSLVFIVGIFIIVCFITIFNSTLISIYEQKKSFGIFKAIGMTPNEIRLSIVYKVVFLAAISIVIGVPLGITIFPKLVGLMLSNVGLVKFPFIFSFKITILTIPICLTVCSLSAWIPSIKILDISPKSLIEE